MTTLQPRPPQQYVDFDQFIDHQLQKTRSTIKLTDVLTAAAGLAVLVLAYLLIFVVFDHWVIEGGFGTTARFLMLGFVFLVSLGWIGWKVVRPYLRQVNRLYAARELEKADPTLRSSLVNLVDAEEAGQPVSPAIREAMRRQAAQNLTRAEVDHAVDRKTLLVLCYTLVGLIVLWAVYNHFSTKKISTSLKRALFPSAAVAVDTQTDILTVTPGDTEVLAGESVEITVALGGKVPERVLLITTTATGTASDFEQEMRAVEGAKQFTFDLRGVSGTGLRETLNYRIEAGDAVSETYTITVQQPPRAKVETITYEYPDYMGRDENPRTVPGGEIDAYEWTTVRVRAVLDQPAVTASIKLTDARDINAVSGDEYTLDPVDASKTTWEGDFTLQLNREDGTRPFHYYIHAQNERGHADDDPIFYPLTIRKDPFPDVTLVGPRQDISRPANATVPVTVRANDPASVNTTAKGEERGEKFRLKTLDLVINSADGTSFHRVPLLTEPTAKYSGTYNLELAKLPGPPQPGDRIYLQVRAVDNKQVRLRANRAGGGLGMVISGNTTTVPARPGLEIFITEPQSEEENREQAEQDRREQQRELDQQNADENEPADNPPQPEERDTTPEPEENQDGEREGEPQDGEGTEGESTTDGTGESEATGEETADGDPSETGSEGTSEGSRAQDSTGDPTGEESGEPGEAGEQSGEQESAPLDDGGRDDQEILEKIRKHQREKEREGTDQPEPQNSTDRGEDSGTDSENAPETGSETEPSDNTGTEPEEASESGEGSETGMDTGDETGSETGTESGEGSETGMGTDDGMNPEGNPESGTENGTREPSNPPSDMDSETGNDTGMPNDDGTTSESGTENRTGTEPNDGSETGDANQNPESGNETGSTPEEGTDPETDSGMGRETGTEPGDETGTDAGMETEDGSETGMGTDDGVNPDETESETGTDTGDGSETGEGTQDGMRPEEGAGSEAGDESETGTGSEEGMNSEEGTGSESGEGTEPGDDPGMGSEMEPGEGSESGTGSEDSTGSDDATGTETETGTGMEDGQETDPGMDGDPSGRGNDPEGDPNTEMENPSDGTGTTGDRPPTDAEPTENERGTGDSGGTENPENADPAPGNRGTDEPEGNPDPRPSETPDGEGTRERAETDGQPNAGNPDLENPEQTPRRSDQPDGGETGNSTGADQGNPSNQEGAGDNTGEGGPNAESETETDTPGTREGEGSTSRPSDRTDPDGQPTEPGEGMETETTDPSGDSSAENPEGRPTESGEGSESAPEEPDSDPTGNPQSGEPSDNPSEQPGSESEANPEGSMNTEQGEPQGDQPGQGNQPGTGNQPGQGNQPGEGKTPSNTPSDGKSGSTPTESGGERRQRDSDPGSSGPTDLGPGEAADLEHGREAAELTLDQLGDEIERGDVSPELLEELGWDESQLDAWRNRMARQIDNLDNPETNALPENERDRLTEILETFGSRRTGEGVEARDPGGIGPKDRVVPSRLRRQWEAYTKDRAASAGGE